MRVLIACEFSGIVRDAFLALGHDAWSCDLLPTEQGTNHIIGEVTQILDWGWDLMIAHPPCTHLAVSGARWWATKDPSLQAMAIDFVMDLWEAPIKRIAIENPIGILPKHIGPYKQIVHPHYFGDHESKATCLWLKNLPRLKRTHYLDEIKIWASTHHVPPSPTRWMDRSRTFGGIAQAMANQWGHRFNPVN